MNDSLLAIITLICVILFLLWFITDTKKRDSEKEKDLLNRIFARDYPTFVNSEVVREAAKRPDQIYEDQEERGIPI